MSDWDILGGNEDGGNGGNGEDVEYVGIEEYEEAANVVQEPARRPQQSVRRVATTGQVMHPVRQDRRNPNGVVGGPNRDAEDLESFINLPHGKQLGLTPQAVRQLNSVPMTELNGQMAQRIEPGTYVMYGPNRAGAMGNLYDEIIEEQSFGTAQPFTHSTLAVQPQGSDAPGWFDSLVGAVADLGTGIAEAVSQSQISEQEAEVERLRIAAEQEADTLGREFAFQEVRLEHAERMSEIAQGAEELATLRAQQEEAAALRASQPLPSVGAGAPGGGGSPVVWILVSVLGRGAVGGIIWFVSRKDEDEDED